MHNEIVLGIGIGESLVLNVRTIAVIIICMIPLGHKALSYS